MLAVDGGEDDVREAELAVTVLSRLPVDQRVGEARQWADERDRCGREMSLPSPGVLAILGAREPSAVRWSTTDLSEGGKHDGIAANVEWERQVDTARGAQVLDVVRRYVGEPVKRGRSWSVSCPFHDDAKPSFSIEPDKGLWYCFPCGIGGDGIELVMRLRHLDFAGAVRELAA